MLRTKWCHQGLTPFRDAPNGKKIMDLSMGAVVEVIGDPQLLVMTGVDNKPHDTLWHNVNFTDAKGLHTGWIRDVYLDDFEERFPDFEVHIPTAAENPTGIHATEDPSDPAQNISIDGSIKRNLCGELCVAFVMHKGADEFLNDWRNTPASQYQWALGGQSDKSTVIANILNMLATYNFFIENGKLTHFTESVKTIAPLSKGVTPGVLMKTLRGMLGTHSLIANVFINAYGKLLPAGDPDKKIAHWVVVDKFTTNGRGSGRVELYNPYVNRRQEFSLDEFNKSFGGGTYTGLWVKREQANAITLDQTASKKWCVAAVEFRDKPAGVKVMLGDEGAIVEPTATAPVSDEHGVKWSEVKYRGRTSWIPESALDDLVERFPDAEVKIQNPTADDNDAAQYLSLEGEQGVKHNMCGELCASYIIGIDVDSFVKDWKNKAAAYYKLAIAGPTDKPTGLDSLQSMFKVSPYDAKPGEVISFNNGMMDPIRGRVVVSPGRIREKLKDYHLLAGVFISKTDLHTGKLSGQGIGHWVVLTSVSPNGRASGNGGWVEIYNPFPNKKQEYSYDEFMSSFRTLDGLLIKKK